MIPCRSFHLFSKFNNGFISPYLICLLQRNAPRMRRFSYIGHVDVRAKHSEQELGSLGHTDDGKGVMDCFGRARVMRASCHSPQVWTPVYYHQLSLNVLCIHCEHLF